MSNLDPAAVRRMVELLASVSPGPWQAIVLTPRDAASGPARSWLQGPSTIDYERSTYLQNPADAGFIAECRTLVPQLLADVERLTLEEKSRRFMQNVIGDCIVALGITNMELADWSTQLPKRIRDLKTALSTTRAEVWREAINILERLEAKAQEQEGK